MKKKGIVVTLTIVLAAAAAVAGGKYFMERGSKTGEKIDPAGRDESDSMNTQMTEAEEARSATEPFFEQDTQRSEGVGDEVGDGTSTGTKSNKETNSGKEIKNDVGEKKTKGDNASKNAVGTEKSEKDAHEISEKDFYIEEIPDDIFDKMQGKSYKKDCTVPREDLRYIHILHMGFDGKSHEGELVVNKAIADDTLTIFEELYKADYPIEKVKLVDEYDADDEASMSDNNSSAFNFRFISHTTKVSKHGLGMAIDINTLYNPYVKTVNGKLSIEPANAAAYIDRSKDFPYKIDHDDLCYQLFTKYGFSWGGDWTHSKDYQHFERDY